MKAVSKLPKGYKEMCSVDMQNNKKTMLVVNGIALLILLVMLVAMLFVIPITETFDFDGELWRLLLRLFVMAVSAFAYLILHELVHGAAMKLCGTKKVKYGFTGAYAFAGSDDYYSKGSYIFIALAPVVLWGAVLLLLNIFLPQSWFWVVYLIQMVNLSGAAGDFFVTFKFISMPKDILVRDTGVAMAVYSARDRKEK